MRSFLQSGHILKLMNGNNTRKYQIDNSIGKGANCLVYEAHCIGGNEVGRKVRIKECYPYSGDIERRGTDLIWKNEAEMDEAIVGFQKIYKRHVEIQNEAILGNSVSHVIDEVMEANHTVYLVIDVDNGITFDKAQIENMSELLQYIKSLAMAVRKYHQCGLVHLDIKPQNFLIIPETRELVKIIDVDSVISIEDIKNHKIDFISSSEGWSAPELMQGRMDLISERTDIYSIGAVLFEKITGRTPENEDKGVFAKWSYDEKIYQNVSSAIRSVICDIFHKSLAANVSKRYESLDEFVNDIDKAYEICQKKEYLVPSCYISDKFFVGRETELKQIEDEFESGHRAVFLHGFGGVGKSELALKYAEKYSSHYDTEIFEFYKGKLEDNILSIRIEESNSDDDKKGNNVIEKLQKIKKLSNKRTLIIIDNFDVDDDVLLSDLLNLDAHFIFTTRNDFSDRDSFAIKQIELERMSTDDLVRLYEHEIGRSIFSAEDKKIVKYIIEKFDNYTLLIPLLARYMVATETPITELYDQINSDGLKVYDSGTDEVNFRKDRTTSKDTLMGHIRSVFRLASLTDDQKQVLINIECIMSSNLYVTKQSYKKYTCSNNLNNLNDMIDLGWISEYSVEDRDIQYIQIHPVIREVIGSDLKPQISKCPGIQKYIELKFAELENVELFALNQPFYPVMLLYHNYFDDDKQKSDKFKKIMHAIRNQEHKNMNNVVEYLFHDRDRMFYFAEKMLSISKGLIDNYTLSEFVSNNLEKDEILSICHAYVLLLKYCLRYFKKNIRYEAELVTNICLLNNRICQILAGILDNKQSKSEKMLCVNKLNYVVSEERKIMQSDFFEDSNHDGEIGSYISKYQRTEIEIVENSIPEASHLFYQNLYMVNFLISYLSSKSDDAVKKDLSVYSLKLDFLVNYADGTFEDIFQKKEMLTGNCNKKSKQKSYVKFEEILNYIPLAISNKRAWEERITESIMTVERSCSNPLFIDKTMLDWRFLDEQTTYLRTKLNKEKFMHEIMSDNRLTDMEKIYLICIYVPKQVNELILLRKKYKNNASFTRRYSKILNIYYAGLKDTNIAYNNEKKSINTMKIELIKAQVCLSVLLGDDTEKMVEVLKDQFTVNNISNIHELSICIDTLRTVKRDNVARQLEIAMLKVYIPLLNKVKDIDYPNRIAGLISIDKYVNRSKCEKDKLSLKKMMMKIPIGWYASFCQTNTDYDLARRAAKYYYTNVLEQISDKILSGNGKKDIFSDIRRNKKLMELIYDAIQTSEVFYTQYNTVIVEQAVFNAFFMKLENKDIMNYAFEAEYDVLARGQIYLYDRLCTYYKRQNRYDDLYHYVGLKYFLLCVSVSDAEGAYYVFRKGEEKDMAVREQYEYEQICNMLKELCKYNDVSVNYK